MKRRLLLLAALVFATPAMAESEIAKGFTGTLRGCETWVLHPATWNDGPAPFITAVGLGDRVARVAEVPPSAMPPPELRRGLQHWKIPVSQKAGYVLTVSHALPMCHFVGQGEGDFAEAVAGVTASPDFAARWEKIEDLTEADGVSTALYRSREEPRFTLVLSRRLGLDPATRAVKLIATATYDPGARP